MHTVAKILIIIGVILAVIVAAGAVLLYTVINEIEDQMGINRSTEELDRMLIKDATYADLVEDTDSYIGQVVKETGQIISIEDLSFGGLTYLVDSGNNEYYTLYDDQIVDDAEERLCIILWHRCRIWDHTTRIRQLCICHRPQC